MSRTGDGRTRRSRPTRSVSGWALVVCVIMLIGGLSDDVQAQSYQTRKLIRNLIKIGYPLDRTDVIALDKIGMRFDSKNRIDVLEKILLDRESIHGRKRFDYFIRTEVICDALRLLDEHDLPVAHSLIDDLNLQDGWEKREQVLLAFMAARRGIRYRANTDYLLNVLPRYDRDLDKNYGVDASQAIIDIMNFLSYITDLFVYKGDTEILRALFEYASKAYGFPAEYLSHMLVDMFLLKPKVFVSNLAKLDDRTIKTVVTSLVFGIRNNQVREKVNNVLKQNLFTASQSNQSGVDFIMKKLKAQIDVATEETPPKVSDPRMNADQ